MSKKTSTNAESLVIGIINAGRLLNLDRRVIQRRINRGEFPPPLETNGDVKKTRIWSRVTLEDYISSLDDFMVIDTEIAEATVNAV